jgi:hypothetical protein
VMERKMFLGIKKRVERVKGNAPDYVRVGI